MRKKLKVLLVRCEDSRPTATRGEYNVCVDDVGGSGLGQQRAYLMRFFAGEVDDVAATKEPP
jgi:hypothetical protein